MSELCKAPASASASAPAPTTDKPKPAGLLQGLGLIGLSSIEAPVLAALATEEPLLLIWRGAMDSKPRFFGAAQQ